MLENSKETLCLSCKKTFEVFADVEQHNQIATPTKCLAEGNTRPCTGTKFQTVDTPAGSSEFDPSVLCQHEGGAISDARSPSFSLLCVDFFFFFRSVAEGMSRLSGNQDSGADNKARHGHYTEINVRDPAR